MEYEGREKRGEKEQLRKGDEWENREIRIEVQREVCRENREKKGRENE